MSQVAGSLCEAATVLLSNGAYDLDHHHQPVLSERTEIYVVYQENIPRHQSVWKRKATKTVECPARVIDANGGGIKSRLHTTCNIRQKH